MKRFPKVKVLFVVIMIIGVSFAIMSCETSSTSQPQSVPTSTPISCGGALVGGYCWYLGSGDQSCSSVCAFRGGYSTATEFFAGSGGNATNCTWVMNALGVSGNAIDAAGPALAGMGCYAKADVSPWVIYRNTLASTTADASYVDRRRACACNN